MKIQNPKIIGSVFVLMAVLVAASMALSGCGGGDSSNNTPADNTSTNNTAGSPFAIGGKTFNGHIAGTSTTWQIVFSGSSGTSGTYSYAENGHHLDSGNFTYTKTGSNTGVVTLTDGTTLQLTYNGPKSGTYFISKSGETGTFTST